MARKKATSRSATKKTPAKKTPAKKRPTKKKGTSTGSAVPFNDIAANLGDAWDQSRAKEPTSGFTVPDVPDDDYIVQLIGARVGVYRSGKRKGTAYLRFRYGIITGDYTGEVVSSSDDLSKESVGSSGKSKLDLLSERLQRMGIDTKTLNLRKLPELCQWLTDSGKNTDAKPCYRVAVKNEFVLGDDGDTRHYQNVYVNEHLDKTSVREEYGADV